MSTKADQVQSGRAVVLQLDGKIVVAGSVADASGVQNMALVRYNGNGTLDSTFGTGGKVTTDFGGNDALTSMALQADGRIVVAGVVFGATQGVALARYSTDGSLDSTFGSGGTVTTNFGGGGDSAFGITLQPDGRLLVVGITDDAGCGVHGLARYNTDGTFDTTFGSGGKVTTNFGTCNQGGLAVALRSDGKIVTAGYEMHDNTNHNFALALYQTDGTLDSSFGTGGMTTTDFGDSEDANAIAVQSDGKIIAVGGGY